MGARPAYVAAAHELGTALAREGIRLVYGGGHVGLMGAVADACIEAGGEVHGVITESLRNAEIAHGSITRLEVVSDMHTRKARMLEIADAFVAMPGGFGTLEELFEVVTWTQLGLHAKPLCLYDVAGFFAHLVEFTRHAGAEGFIKPVHLDLLMVAGSADEVLTRLRSPLPPSTPKWVERLPPVV